MLVESLTNKGRLFRLGEAPCFVAEVMMLQRRRS